MHTEGMYQFSLKGFVIRERERGKTSRKQKHRLIFSGR